MVSNVVTGKLRLSSIIFTLGLLLNPVFSSAVIGPPPSVSPWHCKSGPLGQTDLVQQYSAFNYVFGEAPLTMVARQCYVMTCDENLLALCNWGQYTKTEEPGMRAIIGMGNPGTGVNGCLFNSKRDKNLVYMFGTKGSFTFDGPTDRRGC